MPGVLSDMDIRNIRQRVEKAVAQGGPDPWLLGFDANAIQRFVTASSRPRAMKGASKTVADFDRELGDRPGFVFSGGGRGLLVVPGEARAGQLARELRHRLDELTHGGVLAAAWVPLQRSRERESLAWLASRLVLAKDEAGERPEAPEPGKLCEDCCERAGVLESHKPESTGLICRRCDAMTRKGRTGALDLEQLAGGSSLRNQIVCLSADGNNMGPLFSGLNDLLGQALASAAVLEIFKKASSDAEALAPERIVSVVAGGDDIRAFLSPGDLFSYVQCLARTIEHEGEQVGDAGGLLPAGRLSRLGLGVGAVMAHTHHPASQLTDLAHSLEGRAKNSCGEGRHRSAFAFIRLSSGSELIERKGQLDEEHVFDLAREPWEALLRELEALARVPASQRQRVLAEQALLKSAGEHNSADSPNPHAEFENFFRYQIAREVQWRNYLTAIGKDWQVPAGIWRSAPTRVKHELARLFERDRR